MTLQVDGILGTTTVTVQPSATLSGRGTIPGSVTIADGGHLAPGPGAGTLGVGDLTLSSGSILDYVLRAPGVIGAGTNSLVNVTGDLNLAGILNVTDGGGFGAGAYRLLNYTGTLTGTTLALGTLPAGFTETVSTGVAGQVNLVVSSLATAAQFWDGSQTTSGLPIQGGNGTWNNFTTNFTNAAGSVNQSWQNGVSIFSAAPGTVTLGDNIAFQGLDFTSTGYTIVGAGAFALNPTGTAVITTDAGVSALISASIAGSGGINKAGPGMLTLSGTNTYAGGTTVSGGVLSVVSDANLGAAGVGLILNGGELLVGDGFSTARNVALIVNGGTLAVVGGLADFEGNINGGGALIIGDAAHPGTVGLGGTNTYLGSTTIVSGVTLRANSTVALSPESAFVVLGTLDLNGFSNQIGSLAGSGIVTNGDSVAVVLTAGGNDTDTTFSGVLEDGTHSLELMKTGEGTLVLSGANTYSGGTVVAGGRLSVASDTNLGASTGGLTLSGGSLETTANFTSARSVLVVSGPSRSSLFADSGTTATYTGFISGPGLLSVDGPGTVVLSGINNNYSGGTLTQNGILSVATDANLGDPTGVIMVEAGELLTTGDAFISDVRWPLTRAKGPISWPLLPARERFTPASYPAMAPWSSETPRMPALWSWGE